jgi:hypothetical protein
MKRVGDENDLNDARNCKVSFETKFNLQKEQREFKESNQVEIVEEMNVEGIQIQNNTNHNNEVINPKFNWEDVEEDFDHYNDYGGHYGGYGGVFYKKF